MFIKFEAGVLELNQNINTMNMYIAYMKNKIRL